MEHKILRIATVLGVPGLALGVMYLLLRSFGFSFSTIDPLMSGAIAIIFLLVVGGITSYALHLWRPQIQTSPIQTTSNEGLIDKSSSAANFFQLGYDLRYISTLLEFTPEKVSKSGDDLRCLARSLRLKLHSSQKGDALISFYFDQIGLPLRRDAFNLGFFLAQIEVGRMICDASEEDPEALTFVNSGIVKAIADLRETLQGFGASDLLEGFTSQPTEEQVSNLRFAIKNRLRVVDV